MDEKLKPTCFPGANLSDANLRHADLRFADMRRADLSRANLDFSCWPLWCGSIGVKVDVKIARQLMYHACAVICDDEEFLAVRSTALEFANKFHRVGEIAKLEDKK